MSDYTPPPTEFSPADVVYQLLRDNNKIEINGAGGKVLWRGFVGPMPAATNEGDIEIVSIRDTTPIQAGHILETGHSINQWGIQLRIRSHKTRYNVGWEQANELSRFLSTNRNKPVVIDTIKYRYLGGWISSGPMFIGTEEDTRHHLFTVNPVINIAKG